MLLLCWEVLITSPTVPYLVTAHQGEQKMVESAQNFPVSPPPEKTESPIVLATLVVPEDLVVDVQLLCFCRRGTPKTLEAFNGKRVLITYEFPFAEVLIDFFDRLQSISHGYASFDYEPAR